MSRRFLLVFTTTFILIFTSALAFAESSPIAKSRKLLLGDLSVSSQGGDLYEDVDGNRASIISGSGSVGYFIIPNLAIGTKLSLSRDAQGDHTYTTWGIGPQAHYFIGSAAPKETYEDAMYPFVNASLLYSRSSSKVTLSKSMTDLTEGLEGGSTSITSKHSELTISLGGGVCIMVSDMLGFIIQANYEIDRMSPEEGDTRSGNRIILSAGIVAFGY
jgi:hypothetical protein